MLRITLAINADQLADFEVRNIGPCDCGHCEMHRYTVRPIVDGRQVGDVMTTVRHHRGDGAGVLAANVLAAIQGRVPRG